MSGRPSDVEIIADVAEALPVGVWVARAPGGEFVYANTTFKDIMGMGARPDVARGEYAAPYQIHDRAGSLYPEDRLPFVRALNERRTVMVDDIVIHRPEGGNVDIRAYAKPIFVGEEISHVVIAFFDISREVEAERARAESEARLRQSQRMESIGNLAGGISHDFNNLLGAVRVIASTLLLDESSPQRREDLQAIEAATESALSLTRALLGFSGQGKNLAAPVSLNDVVKSVAEIFERTFDKRIRFKVDLQANRSIVGDHSRLEQVLMNLVLNARDAMPEGGLLTIRTRIEGDEALLEVEDTGPGVPLELRERIFEPYFTTKARGTRGGGGSGLGLATAYGIVESHGGRLQLHEAPHGGALFRASFPASMPASDTSATDTSREIGTRTGSGLVLVADDEPAVLRGTARALERVGYRVLKATDGAEAVDLYRQHRHEISCVLLDMTMPRLDGRSALLAMRAIDPSVKAVLMTGYALNEEAQAILDLGGCGFIEKPFAVAALSQVIGRILG